MEHRLREGQHLILNHPAEVDGHAEGGNLLVADRVVRDTADECSNVARGKLFSGDLAPDQAVIWPGWRRKPTAVKGFIDTDVVQLERFRRHPGLLAERPEQRPFVVGHAIHGHSDVESGHLVVLQRAVPRSLHQARGMLPGQGPAISFLFNDINDYHLLNLTTSQEC